MKCTNCGNELEENAKFCASCGAVVEQAKPAQENVKQEEIAEETIVEEKPVKEKDNKCKNCGTALEEGVKFCPVCGTSTVPQEIRCTKCGIKIEPGVKFCPSCGTPAPVGLGAGPRPFAPMPNTGGPQVSAKQVFDKIGKTPDTTAEYDAEEIETYKRISVVAYLGLLVLIPIFTFPKSKFTRYHSNQGLLLCILDVIFGIIASVLSALGSVLVLRFGFTFGPIIYWIFAGLVIFAGSVILIYLIVTGIINAVKGRARELPVIGKIRLLK